MNKYIFGISLAVIVLVAGGAYWAWDTQVIDSGSSVETRQTPVTSGENPQPGSSVHDLPVEPAAAAARKDLAATLSIPETSIVIMQITETTWSDGCLGLGTTYESCVQAIVVGFKVEMLAQGETYVYRTDDTGAVVRQENN